jgi:hypothetical protein
MSNCNGEDAMHAYQLGRMDLRETNAQPTEVVGLVILDEEPNQQHCVGLALAHLGIDPFSDDWCLSGETLPSGKRGELPVCVSLPEGERYIYYLLPALAA